MHIYGHNTLILCWNYSSHLLIRLRVYLLSEIVHYNIENSLHIATRQAVQQYYKFNLFIIFNLQSKLLFDQTS